MKGILNFIRNLLMFRIKYPYVEYGKNVHVQLNCIFWAPNRKIKIGDNVGIGFNCLIQNDIEFGNNILVASHVAFIGRDAHKIDIVGKTIWESGSPYDKMIIIEDDVWIGHGVIILSGVKIGRGSVIAAGSVITKDVAPYSIMISSPAKLLRKRFSDEEIMKHEKALYAKS